MILRVNVPVYCRDVSCFSVISKFDIGGFFEDNSHSSASFSHSSNEIVAALIISVGVHNCPLFFVEDHRLHVFEGASGVILKLVLSLGIFRIFDLQIVQVFSFNLRQFIRNLQTDVLELRISSNSVGHSLDSAHSGTGVNCLELLDISHGHRVLSEILRQVRDEAQFRWKVNLLVFKVHNQQRLIVIFDLWVVPWRVHVVEELDHVRVLFVSFMVFPVEPISLRIQFEVDIVNLI